MDDPSHPHSVPLTGMPSSSSNPGPSPPSYNVPNMSPPGSRPYAQRLVNISVDLAAFILKTLAIFGLGLGVSSYLLTDCPEGLLDTDLIWPIACLSVQAVILVVAVVVLFSIDGTVPGPWNHVALNIFFVISIYLPLAVLPCATHHILKLAIVFCLSHAIFFLSLILFNGHLHGTGHYGVFMDGVGEFLRYVGAGLLVKARRWPLRRAGDASIALPGPDELPSYTDTDGPARLATPKSHPAIRMV